MSTVEEKIDYIMECCESELASICKQMFDTGYPINYIFILLSEIAKGEDDLGGEFVTALSSYLTLSKQIESNTQIKNIYKKCNDLCSDVKFQMLSASMLSLLLPTDLPKYQEVLTSCRDMKSQVDERYGNILKDIREVFENTNKRNKNNPDANLNSEKSKDERFAINRTFFGYVVSFLKNIFLDLTFIYPIYKIFLSVSRFNNLKTEINNLKTEITTEAKANEAFDAENKSEKSKSELVELQQSETKTVALEAIQQMFANVLRQISKKNNIWLLILNAIICCTPTILLVLSLIFAWGMILDYIFVIALSALILYKGIERYRQERRKYFAIRANQLLPERNTFSVNLVLSSLEGEIVSIKQNLSSILDDVILRIQTIIETHKQRQPPKLKSIGPTKGI